MAWWGFVLIGIEIPFVLIATFVSLCELEDSGRIVPAVQVWFALAFWFVTWPLVMALEGIRRMR